MSATEVYRKTRKVPDLFWNAYVCRPIAAVLVNVVEGTRITPNQITLSAVFVALVSVGLLLVWPGHLGLIAAVVVGTWQKFGAGLKSRIASSTTQIDSKMDDAIEGFH